MIKEPINHSHGFTLIELLLVMGMLGVVMTSVYSIYIVHSRSATTQDEVVEVQQNIRIGMDDISRDIKMSGILLPPDAACSGYPLPPVNNVGDDTGLGGTDTLTLNTASESAKYARNDVDIPNSGMSTVFTVDSSEAVDIFKTGDKVRIISAQSSIEYAGGPFTITDKDRDAKTLTISTSAGIHFKQYDMIVGTAGGPAPETIRYCIGPDGSCGSGVTSCPAGQRCLMRIVNNATTDVIASHIDNLQFTYLLKDNTEVSSPADRRQVRAVRITLSGKTVTSTGLTGGLAKQRQMVTIVKLRNEAKDCP